MILSTKNLLRTAAVLCILPAGLTGCKASGNESSREASQPFMSAVASAPLQTADDAPLPEKTGGFDGKRAFAHVAKQVSFGPRCVIGGLQRSGSDGAHEWLACF